MSWSELDPRIRAAIALVAFLFLALLLWRFWVQPQRAGAAASAQQLEGVEAQLAGLTQQVSSVPPPTDAERAAWRATEDELYTRLGPQSELPLMIESLVRLADAQEIELFITTEDAAPVAANNAARQRLGGPAGAGTSSQTERVLAAVAGSGYLPLNCRIYGDFASTSRFLSQISRLGWVIEIASITMERSFPEVVSDVELRVFFRPSARSVDPGATGAGDGASGAFPGGGSDAR